MTQLAKFVTVGSDGFEVVTSCIVDTETHRITDIETQICLDGFISEEVSAHVIINKKKFHVFENGGDYYY